LALLFLEASLLLPETSDKGDSVILSTDTLKVSEILVQCNRIRDTLPGIPGEKLLCVTVFVLLWREEEGSKRQASCVLLSSAKPNAKSRQTDLLGALIAMILQPVHGKSGKQSLSTFGAIVLGRKPKNLNAGASQQGRAQR